MSKCKLPKKASALIRMAIEDLEKAEGDRCYRIFMGTWHDSGDPETVDYDSKTCKVTVIDGEPCVICWAGSVMAFSLNAPPNVNLVPSDFSDHNAERLVALDLFGHGDLGRGLNAMNIAWSRKRLKKAFDLLAEDDGEEDPMEARIDVVAYHANAKLFKRQMLNMAQGLEEVHL